jgi:aldose 1-epimerase
MTGSRDVPCEAACYGSTADGRPVSRYTLRNGSGMMLRVLSLGGIVSELHVPDRDGRMANVVLGCDSLKAYRGPAAQCHFGGLIGRFANRIAGAQFRLDGQTHRLEANDGVNTLHSGAACFDTALWRIAPLAIADGAAVRLHHRSPHGEGGFPGTLDVQVTYRLLDDRSIVIDYAAQCDAPTVLNLTNHSYFNLAGHGAGDVLDHRIAIAAERFTPIDAAMIPTGEIAPVDGTPLDLRRMQRIGDRLRDTHPQMLRAHGYDHNFVLDRGDETAAPILAARVHEPQSGRVLEVLTSQPCVQFYSGNFLDGSIAGAAGASLRQSDGFALETQAFPDAPNQPQFPSTRLAPGETFVARTVWRWRTDAEQAV